MGVGGGWEAVGWCKGKDSLGGRGGGVFGGHCLFESRYSLPNYCPCFFEISTPKFSLTDPYF